MPIDLCNEPSISYENLEKNVIQTLEKRIAQLFKKEDAIFMSSRYTSNMCTILSHYDYPGKIIIGDKSHMYLFDKVQYKFNGISWKNVSTFSNGAIQIEKIDIENDNVKMICIEDTIFQENDDTYKPYMESLRETANDLHIHLDGIHIWNYIVRKKINPTEIASYFDSMTIHLSKCSGGSYGNVLLGTHSFIEKARNVKKMISNNESPKIAHSFMELLDDYTSGVLENTYAKAKKIADAMNRMHIFKVQPIETNIIFADVVKPIDATIITKIMKENGVAISTWANQLLRMVVHKNISDSDVKNIIHALQKAQERVHIFEIQ